MGEPQQRLARVERDFAAFRYEDALAAAVALHGDALQAEDHAVAADAALVAAKAHANLSRHGPALEWAERASASADADGGLAGKAERQAQAWALVASECARGDRPGPAMHAVGRVLPLLGELRAPRVLSTVFSGLAFTYTALCMPEQALDSARHALTAIADLGEDAARLRCTVNFVQAGLDAWDLQAAPGRSAALLAELQGHCRWLRQRWESLPARDEGERASWVELLARVQVRAGDSASARALLEAQLQRHWTGTPAMHRDLWIDLARLQQADGDVQGALRSAQFAAALHARVDRPPRTGELPYLSSMEELRGDTGAALALAREHQRRTQAVVLGALQARVDELSTQLLAQSLRWENADLRSRNEGLAASVVQITELASTDPLTGLLNRRALQALWHRREPQGSCSVAMVDIDHFKTINDTHTHAVGDAVLREAARVMAQALRHADHMGRYGGEEFVALLPGLTLDVASAALERLRAAVQGHDWSRLAPGLVVTVSVGLTEALPGEAFDAAMARADSLLYRAKREGRNRVACAPAH